MFRKVNKKVKYISFPCNILGGNSNYICKFFSKFFSVYFVFYPPYEGPLIRSVEINDEDTTIEGVTY